MEPTTQPAPLRLAPVPTAPTTPPPAPPRHAEGPFIDFGQASRSHAKAARLFLADAEEALLGIAESDASTPLDFDRVDALVQAAQAHALTSIAFTQLAPPARRSRTKPGTHHV